MGANYGIHPSPSNKRQQTTAMLYSNATTRLLCELITALRKGLMRIWKSL